MTEQPDASKITIEKTVHTESRARRARTQRQG
jgi:hypothetical protein